ncbi:glycoside hydrolase family 3 N-terminal domain-containing protein [Bifidobacterium sp. ESL0732]|uniref:beta-glucosidase n=1 Tax=Bifidobacterium sp. ESL0732 TaxID=2983222 RepID=UPI0023F99B00|nr:glycoside hydrolase family 3 N-terminal domain-containing protein [Bifidobacterium sp. ESL0732]WEV64089.1 glycoside hydrolase family 3 C-terminal domain-containing protein [Bifidobacterium sp. ESL0732]
MLGINMDDVIAVVHSLVPYLVAIGVLLIVAIIITAAANRKTLSDTGVRKMVHNQTWIVALVGIVVAVSMILTGPVQTLLNNASTPKQQLTQNTIKKTNGLAVNIENEAITLLQNNNNTLPLNSSEPLNVFGWASTNPIYGGTGSGSLDESYKTTSLLDGLHQAGYKTNTELSKFYTDYSTKRGEIAVTSADWTLPEPPAENYSSSLMDNAKKFSKTAVVVVGRVGGEGLDLPTDMRADGTVYKNNSKKYDDFAKGQHYLELNRTEQDMINLVTSNFSKVVLVYNGANVFQLNFIKQYPQIKSVLWVPHPGQAGFKSLGDVMSGKINPSGKTSDTFLTNLKETPTWNNFGDFPYKNVDEFKINSARGMRSPRFVNYVEGIYVGYRFYETAAKEGLINYTQEVQYPFGYGMSYTKFNQKMGKVSHDNGKVSFDVTVSNTGNKAGKDVVEVYYDPPYTNGGIEKASTNLVTFSKTKLLKPGESQDVKISFNDSDMASYDDKNAKAYVLDKGDYDVSIQSDSHTVLDHQDVSVAKKIVYNTKSNMHNGDKQVATNRFDSVRGNVNYLSRANHFANYAAATAAPTDFNMSAKVKATYYNNGNYDPKKFDKSSDQMPTMGAKNNIRLASLRGKSYDDPKWEKLLDELTFKDMDNLIANTGYQNPAIDSIGKIRLSDVDGPAALKDNFTKVGSIGLPSNVAVACTWNTELAREFGRTIGDMAHEMLVSGWYAPSVNIHRSPFGGRTFEYFSEDPILTANLAKEQVLGAADKGVYSFTKHFALNEQETQRNGQLCTWSDEQALREIYLKPFELIVKADGDAQGIMGSFNYVGNTYSSANSTLNNTILRGEWGFKGFVETDYFSGSNYSYQNADQIIRGGTDAMLATTKTTNHITDKSATSIKAMRQSCKNILYTAVNGWRYEHGEPGKETPVWRIAMYVVWGVTAVLVVGLEVLAIMRFRKRRLTSGSDGADAESAATK